jgi:threonine/homoserine/homoserine lactone efflux protein|tara:strand:+ start:4096 stop:4701 length:606 start_codon:yes stop_codon:yes gene_type:complete
MFIWSSIAHLIALTSPGPDTAIIVRQVNMHGRRAGIYAAFGIGIGIYAHCLLAINGISLFIISNDLYKFLISLIGSIYIIYLGIMMIIPNVDSDNSHKINRTSLYGSFLSGLVTNIFNFKAFIFFVSLFSILIESIEGIYFYIYPIYFSITSSLWFILLSYLLTSSKSINIQGNKLINKLLAIILCIIGLFILIKSFYEYF